MRWIVVDGIDGSGKNTVAQSIKEYYERRGERVATYQHPSDRFFGRISRRWLQNQGKLAEILSGLFFILDVLSSLSRLRRSGSRYQTTIFVRYLMGTAYLPNSLYKTGYRFFASVLPVPRRLLLVDIDPEVACSRIRSRTGAMEIFENTPTLTKIRGRMIGLAFPCWKVIDNSGSGESTIEQVHKVLKEWDSIEDPGKWPFA